MTKIFIILLLWSTYSSSQSIYGDTIISRIEYIKTLEDFNSNPNRRYLDGLWNQASNFFDSLRFVKNANLIEYINTNSSYIKSQRDSNIIIGGYGSFHFQLKYQEYLNSLNYQGLNKDELYNKLIHSEDISLLIDEVRSRYLYSFDRIFYGLDDSSKFLLIQKLFDFNEFDSYIGMKTFIKFKDIIRADSILYFKYMFNINKIGTIMSDSIINKEEQWSKGNLNTYWSNSKEFKDIFYDPIAESIRIENEIKFEDYLKEKREEKYKWLERQDSILSKIDFSDLDTLYLNYLLDKRNDPNLFLSGEDIIQFIELDSLPELERRLEIIASDTTLWTESLKGYKYIPSKYDTGFRADILSNIELLSYLDLIPVTIYESFGNSSDSLNAISRIVIVKIFQIIGDRNSLGLFAPDSNQNLVINKWIDFYKSVICNDTNYFKKMEAHKQLLKLWRLLFPRLKEWIVSGQICLLELYSYSGRYFNTFLNEALVSNIISDGDSYFTSNEKDKVNLIGNFLMEVWRNIEVSPDLVVLRRPHRELLESQELVDNFIYPALKRWNHPGIK